MFLLGSGPPLLHHILQAVQSVHRRFCGCTGGPVPTVEANLVTEDGPFRLRIPVSRSLHWHHSCGFLTVFIALVFYRDPLMDPFQSFLLELNPSTLPFPWIVFLVCWRWVRVGFASNGSKCHSYTLSLWQSFKSPCCYQQRYSDNPSIL